MNLSSIFDKDFLQTMKTTGDEVSGLDKNIQKTNKSFGTMAIKSKAASIGVGLLNTMASMGISILAGLAITGAIKLFDVLKETPKEIAEAAQLARDEIDELVNSLSKAQELVSTSGKRFAELSQGTNQFTGENEALPTEEYEEFLSLNSQLAEMFPQLSRHYMSNGDAIVQLGGNVDTIIGSLEELIDTQKRLGDQELVKKLPDVFKGYQANVDKYSKRIKEYEADIDALDSQLTAVLSGERIYHVFDQASNDYASLLDSLGVEWETVLNQGTAGSFDETLTYILPSEEDIKDAAEKTSNTYKGQIATLQQQIQAENVGMQKYFFAFLSTDWDYMQMVPEMQSAVQNAVSRIDWKTVLYNGELVNSWEDAEGYIKDNIINVLSKTSQETQTAFAEMLSVDFDTVSASKFIDGYNQFIEDVIKELKLDEEQAAEFRVTMNYVIEDQQSSLDKVKNKLDVNDPIAQEDKTIKKWVDTLPQPDLELLLTLDVDEDTSLFNLKAALDEAKTTLADTSLIDLSPIHEELDRIQSAYQTVATAIHEYDTTQTLSLDTIQSLLELEDKYLAVLYDENGQLQLNTETYNNLTKAKLQQMQIDIISNAMATFNSLTDEATAKEYLKNVTLDVTGAKWEEVYATIALARAELKEAESRDEDVDDRLAALDRLEESTRAKEELFKEAEKSLSVSADKFYGYTPPKQDKPKEDNVFDWIANSVDNASREVDKLNEKLSNASLNDKIPIYEELKTANQTLVDTTKAAAEAYENEWTEKASKISPEYKNKIMSSEVFDIETIKDEDEYKAIKEAKEAFDARNASAKEYTDSLQKQKQLEKDIISNNLAIEQLKLDTLSYVNQDNMSALEKNKLLKEEENILYNILQDNLALAQSEEEKIKLEDEYQQKLDESAKKQRENNRQERENKINFYESRVKDIQNEIDLEESKGGQGTETQYLEMNQALDDQLKHYNLAYDEAFDDRNVADWGTDAWDEANTKLQEAQDNINACTIAQLENNRAILMLPIKKYEDLNKELEKDLETQNKILEKTESALGYAQLLVQDEIDALNEDKDAVTKRYEEQIKAIQEEKDALTESNDEREREIALENAKWNLSKAMNNRTVRVYRAGSGFVYEQDQKAVHDAQAELDQLEFDNTVAGLDKQIDTLNKDKEDELEVIDNEIKTWEDYAKKLDEVSDSYDRLISKRNFLELFGAPGETNVLQQDTSIITSLGTALNAAKGEVDTIQAKIDANNLTIQKITEEAESYLGTTRQIKEAQEAIDKAIVENEDEIKAIEARSEKTGAMAKSWTDADIEVEKALDLIDTAQTEGKNFENTVLGERKLTLEQFRDAAVLLYKEIAEEVTKANLAFSTLETTLTKAQQTYKEILALANGTGDIETTVTYTFPDYRTFHSGGIVGQETPKNKLPKHLMSLTDANLKPNETLAKLLNGEVVLNTTQMGNMFDNLNRAYSALTPLNKRESSPVEITIGDVNVYNPENTDMIVNEIVKELPLKVIQRLHSK